MHALSKPDSLDRISRALFRVFTLPSGRSCILVMYTQLARALKFGQLFLCVGHDEGRFYLGARGVRVQSRRHSETRAAVPRPRRERDCFDVYRVPEGKLETQDCSLPHPTRTFVAESAIAEVAIFGRES